MHTLAFMHAQLIETQKPYLSAVFRARTLPTLLLFASTVDSSADARTLLIDHWLEIRLKSDRAGIKLLSLMVKLRSALSRLLHVTLSRAATAADGRAAEIFECEREEREMSRTTHSKESGKIWAAAAHNIAGRRQYRSGLGATTAHTLGLDAEVEEKAAIQAATEADILFRESKRAAGVIARSVFINVFALIALYVCSLLAYMH